MVVIGNTKKRDLLLKPWVLLFISGLLVALGDAYDYIVNGQMIGGFALVAYPARYGSSGIMTFIVSHAGQVYQNDLGENTENSALKMMRFNPDSTWSEAEGRVAKGN